MEPMLSAPADAQNPAEPDRMTDAKGSKQEHASPAQDKVAKIERKVCGSSAEEGENTEKLTGLGRQMWQTGEASGREESDPRKHVPELDG